jgi:hypothetical protein
LQKLSPRGTPLTGGIPLVNTSSEDELGKDDRSRNFGRPCSKYSTVLLQQNFILLAIQDLFRYRT